ncbi:transmembrane protein 184C-like [Fukomys damarensis]|uniref:transmembrane protein 184C-like n=1 Tax=Fukomys damarensis TaxID=885580 RepID=UPI00145554A0|nr:transmembrane protein 184C-like [Fukomys damarensis]
MYCLILFYTTLKEELKPLHPIGKFLSMKFVIFVSFWQGVIISLLVKYKVIARGPLWDWHSPEEVAIGLQDFLFCLEMLVAGIAHHHLFSHKPHVQSQEEGSWFKSSLAMWDFSDITDDVAEQISHMGWTIHGQHKPKNHTEVINTPEEMVSDTAGAKKCEYIALTVPDEVVSDSPDDTLETAEEEAVKEVEE